MSSSLPLLIQGGMGAGVSGWRLARSVSQLGQLGVVSGTALDVILARRLQNGDADGSLRRALARFPYPEIAERILEKYFVPAGARSTHHFRSVPMATLPLLPDHEELLMAATFAEVFLAKEGHSGAVGINFLEKIQLPLLPSLYGAMLAGVDVVLVGAGIPVQVPGVLDRLARREPVSYKLDVEGADASDEFLAHFDPGRYPDTGALKRPQFLAIVASATLAAALAKRSSGRVDGFVLEGPKAGGHNAPPRGELRLDAMGQPIYGERDEIPLENVRKLGLPFWLAGSYGSPARVFEALRLGAAGVQVGTAFAFCEESGMDESVRSQILRHSQKGEVRVFTDPLASPTGFPFKVVGLEGSLSEDAVSNARPRLCDLGYLRHLFKRKEGGVGYRCPGEPLSNFLSKGGAAIDTVGKKCLCNGLMATIGLAQHRLTGYIEKPIVTAGEELSSLLRFFSRGRASYSAEDVVRALLGNLAPAL